MEQSKYITANGFFPINYPMLFNVRLHRVPPNITITSNRTFFFVPVDCSHFHEPDYIVSIPTMGGFPQAFSLKGFDDILMLVFVCIDGFCAVSHVSRHLFPYLCERATEVAEDN